MTSDRRPVFLDADVLAASLTRTLIMTAAVQDGAVFTPRWSLRVEAEADRHARPGQTRLVDVRARWWGADALVPSTDDPSLADTHPKDRHVIASARDAGIGLIVSRNIADFGQADLVRCGVSVAHPDLFLASVVGPADYLTMLEDICSRRSRAPNVPEVLHRALAAEHPRLFEAMSPLFPTVSADQGVRPSLVFRGASCLVCGRPLTDTGSLASGVGPECHRS